MIFVTGPAGGGKLEYIRSLGYSDDQISVGMLSDVPVITDVQDLVMSWDIETEELVSLLSGKEVVACDEIGSGIIPFERYMREAREKVGRTAVLLAESADKVVRVICGIPQVIK